jgi:predicted enzyme related to lactoylglutathione lyase
MKNAISWFEIPSTDLERAGVFIDSEGNRIGLHSIPIT